MIIGPYYVLPGENGFRGSLLDEYLAAGYYRMLHTVFTTHYTQLDMEGDALPVFWLRTRVSNIRENKTARIIRKKCEGFMITVEQAVISPEVETLYSLYHKSIDFTTSGSCRECMHDSSMDNPFDSMMITIRHGGLLVAAGYFDVGQLAITGILNFYHPGYKKYSLGKYLMLQKIDWALANGRDWYYTGYLCTGHAKFDYKLFPDVHAMEVYLPVERKWVAFAGIGKKGLQGYWMKLLRDAEGI